jgi:Sulfotransferase domain
LQKKKGNMSSSSSSSSSFDRAPRFLILGVQKCGTTALYDYLCQHPHIGRARGKETHFLDWRYNSSHRLRLSRQDCESVRRWFESGSAHAQADDDDEPIELSLHGKYRALYPLDWLLEDERRISGEATPSYLLMGSVVAKRALRHCGAACKLIVIVRDPTRRAYSQYNMTRDTNGTARQLKRRGFAHLQGRSFDDVILDELEMAERAALKPGMELDAFQRFLDAIDWGAGTRVHGGHSYLARGLYALQIKLWARHFAPEQFIVVRLEQLTAGGGKSEALSARMAPIFEALGLKPCVIEDAEPKNARRYEPMSEHIRERLGQFFAPFNREFDELCAQYSWCGVKQTEAN